MVYFSSSMSACLDLGSIVIECAEPQRMDASVTPDPSTVLASIVKPDIRAAINSLSDADHVRLVGFAGALAFGSGLDPQEIYNDAIVAALEESRVWPPDVALVPFLKMSMRSIASNAKKKTRRAPLFPIGGDADGLGDLIEISGSVAAEGPGAAEVEVVGALDSKRLVDKVFALFEDDLEAQMVLMARIEDKDAVEIKADMELNDTRYASIIKKIKRRLIALATPIGR